MWTFTLIYSTYYTLKYNKGPISHIVVISNVWFGTDAQTIFPPMGAQITSIVFTPMRSELKKLNWSTYPLSRILSPFRKSESGKNIFSTWQDVLSETGETGNSLIITNSKKDNEGDKLWRKGRS